MGGVVVSVIGAVGLGAAAIVLGRWLGNDKGAMREARDATNARRLRSGDHDGHVGGGWSV